MQTKGNNMNDLEKMINEKVEYLTRHPKDPPLTPAELIVIGSEVREVFESIVFWQESMCINSFDEARKSWENTKKRHAEKPVFKHWRLLPPWVNWVAIGNNIKWYGFCGKPWLIGDGVYHGNLD